jgi:hypothetical protein
MVDIREAAIELVRDHYVAVFAEGADQRKLAAKQDFQTIARDIVDQLGADKIGSAADLEAVAKHSAASLKGWPAVNSHVKALGRGQAPRDESGRPEGEAGPDGVVRGKGYYPGWKPLKTAWDGRWRATRAAMKPEHRRPLAFHEGYVDDAGWEKLRAKQTAAARQFFRDDVEGRALAAEAVAEHWASALWWWFVEEGRLPSDAEAERLVSQAVFADGMAQRSGAEVLRLRNEMIYDACREMGCEASVYTLKPVIGGFPVSGRLRHRKEGWHAMGWRIEPNTKAPRWLFPGGGDFRLMLRDRDPKKPFIVTVGQWYVRREDNTGLGSIVLMDDVDVREQFENAP